MVKIEFDVVFSRGKWKLPDAFYGMKKISFIAKVIVFSNLENTCIYIARADFKRDFPKMDIFEISIWIFFYIFYPISIIIN